MQSTFAIFRSALFCAALVLGLAGASSAQEASGSLHGSVQDPHHATIANTSVKVTNLDTGKVYSAHTDDLGEYEVNGLPAGVYGIDVQVAGFKAVQLRGIKVVAAAVTQDVNLELDTSVQSINVSAVALDSNLNTNIAPLMNSVEAIKADAVVFTAKDIEALQPETVYDLLRTVPGFEIEYQGRQGMFGMTLRGGSVMVIIDGTYFTEVTRQMSLFPVQLIESMTVVHDATALSIGPLAGFSGISIPNQGGAGSNVGIQGFVIIKTKRASGLDAGFVSNGGNWQTGMGHAYVGNKSGNWDYLAAYTYYETQGAPSSAWTMAARSASMDFHGGYTGKKLNLDFSYFGLRGARSDEAGVLALPIWRCTSVTVASTCAYYTTSGSYTSLNAATGKYATWYQGELQPSSGEFNPDDADIYNFNSSYRWNANNRTFLHYGFYNAHITTNGYFATTTGMWNDALQNNTQGDLNLAHTTCFKGHCLTGGGQFIKLVAPEGIAPYAGKSYYVNAGTTASPDWVWKSRIDQSLLSWYAQDEWWLPSKRLTIDAGVRSDSLHYGWINGGTTKTDLWMKPFYTIAAGASYQATGKLRIGTRYGFVQAQPPSNDVVKGGGTLANQSQQRTEISADYKLKRYLEINLAPYGYLTSNGTSLTTGCTGFPSGVSEYTDSNGNTWYCVAAGAITIGTYGIDSNISGQIRGPVTYNAGYGYIEENNQTNNIGMTHHTVHGEVDYRTKTYFGDLNMTYDGPKWYNTSGLMNQTNGTLKNQPALAGYFPYYPQSNYVQLNGNVGYNFKFVGRPMTFTFTCNNINNQQVSTNTSGGSWTPPGEYGFFPNPGRNFTFQLAGKVFGER